MTYLIYKDTCLSTGKVYVGVTKHSPEWRWQQKVSKANRTNMNYKILNAIRQHGSEEWCHEVLTSCDDESMAYELEQKYIQENDSYENGYNSTLGGETPTQKRISNQHKKHISEGLKKAYKEGRRSANVFDEESIQKYRDRFQTGIWHTPYGSFQSKKLAAEALNTSRTNIRNWCINYNDHVITSQTPTRLPHIFKKEHIGMTFNQIGFSFESVS